MLRAIWLALALTAAMPLWAPHAEEEPPLPVQGFNMDEEALSPLDVSSFGRNLCLLERSQKKAGASSSDMPWCHQLTDDQATEIRKQAASFCSSPATFCAEIIKTEKAESEQALYKKNFDELNSRFRRKKGGAALNRVLKFVGPRCEPATRPGVAGDGIAFHGATYRQMLTDLWGCRTEFPEDSKSHAFTLQMSCDPDKMPFACKPYGLKSPEKLKAPDVKQINDEFNGLGPRLVSGKCVLTASKYEKGKTGPFTCPSGAADPFACEEKQVNSMNASLGIIGNPLYGLGSKRFAESYRLIGSYRVPDLRRPGQTQSALEMVKEKFQHAQEGVLAYLDKIHAPDDVKNRVKSTRLLGINPDDPKETADVEALCRKPENGALGVNNAFNACNCSFHKGANGGKPTFAPDNQITVCPSMILDAVLGNPKTLLQLFGHELGHSIDPCGLGQAKTAVGWGSAGCDLKPTEAVSSGYDDFMRSTQAFSQCLFNNSRMKRADSDYQQAEVRPNGTQQLWKDIMPFLDEKGKCRAKAFLDPSLLGSCSSPPSDVELSKIQPKAKADEAKALAQSVQHGQQGEAFADYIGAQSFALSVEKDDPEFAKFSPDEKKADVLTSLIRQCGAPNATFSGVNCGLFDLDTDKCTGGYKPNSDPHPANIFRVSMFASAPNIRAAICEPPTLPSGASGAGNSTQLPSAACQMGGPQDCKAGTSTAAAPYFCPLTAPSPAPGPPAPPSGTPPLDTI